jgi:hypothetical protein
MDEFLRSEDRVMRRGLTYAALVLASCSLGACAHLGATPKDPYTTPAMRRAAIQRAAGVYPTDVPSMDLRTSFRRCPSDRIKLTCMMREMVVRVAPFQ